MKRGTRPLDKLAPETGELWPPLYEVAEVGESEQLSLASALVELTDSWLNERAEQFDPFRWSTTDERYARRKSFAEAAIYLYVTAAHGEPDAAPKLREIMLDRVSQPEYAELVRRYPRHFLLFSSPIVYASSQGELTPGLSAAVDEVLSGKTIWATERPPHRMMDLWNFCAASGKESKFESVDELLKLGAGALELDPVESNLRDAYALTHNLLFLYNFGVATDGIPTGPIEAHSIGDNLEASITPLTLRFLAEDNLDVALELVMVGALQRRLPRGLASLVTGRTLAEAKRHGGIPGPKQDESHRLDVDDEKFQSWYADYHTTLVAASTFRTIRRDWSVVDGRASSRTDDQWDPAIAFMVGEALNRLHRYELPLSIAQFTELSDFGDNPIVAQAIEAATSFLSRQTDGEGRFGLFPDERHAHESVLPADRSFDIELGDEVSSMVSRFLQAA